jgi:hypothetical protein
MDNFSFIEDCSIFPIADDWELTGRTGFAARTCFASWAGSADIAPLAAFTHRPHLATRTGSARRARFAALAN